MKELRFRSIVQFADQYEGYTEISIIKKIASGEWKEGNEYVIAPDGRVFLERSFIDQDSVLEA